MGKYTDKLTKVAPHPFGQGTAAMKVAVLDPKMDTSVDQFVRAYAGTEALLDLWDWLETASSDQKWTCESPAQTNNLVVYLDQACILVMIRETPKGKWLPHSHPCETFFPDASLKMLDSMIPED